MNRTPTYTALFLVCVCLMCMQARVKLLLLGKERESNDHAYHLCRNRALCLSIRAEGNAEQESSLVQRHFLAERAAGHSSRPGCLLPDCVRQRLRSQMIFSCTSSAQLITPTSKLQLFRWTVVQSSTQLGCNTQVLLGIDWCTVRALS